MFAYRKRLTSAIFLSSKSTRFISSTSYLTSKELSLFWKHKESKSHGPPGPVSQKPPILQPIHPQIYESSGWVSLDNNNNHHQNCLQRGSILKVVSWNIDAFNLGQAERASAALCHLEELFGTAPGNLAVMLQGVTHDSLQAIRNSSWAQKNFTLSNVGFPSSLYTEVPGISFVMKIPYRSAARYSTLLMVPRYLGGVSCFRAPFVTGVRRDALFVDIPLSSLNGRTRSEESLRLCTTHLESLFGRKAYRAGQLAMISALLKGPLAADSRIVAGLVGGDMNAVDTSEHELHKARDVDLKDVWEDVPALPVPVRKPFQKDYSYGRARGNTWGYQSERRRNRKRMDKFFYTGLETVALTEPTDFAGKLGRVGIGLKTKVEAWERETSEWSVVRGRLVQKPAKEYFSLDQARRIGSDLVRREVDTWVSDHFGIAIGVKVT